VRDIGYRFCLSVGGVDCALGSRLATIAAWLLMESPNSSLRASWGTDSRVDATSPDTTGSDHGWPLAVGEPKVRQLVLLDAPEHPRLGQAREISQRYGIGLTERLLNAAITARQPPAQSVRPLATMLIGALDEPQCPSSTRRTQPSSTPTSGP
jgi:hypothetical protein